MAFESIKRNFSKPGPLQIASRMLEEAEINRLESMEKLEYYSAIEKMYRDRIQRLKKDIKALAEESEIANPAQLTLS